MAREILKPINVQIDEHVRAAILSLVRSVRGAEDLEIAELQWASLEMALSDFVFAKAAFGAAPLKYEIEALTKVTIAAEALLEAVGLAQELMLDAHLASMLVEGEWPLLVEILERLRSDAIFSVPALRDGRKEIAAAKADWEDSDIWLQVRLEAWWKMASGKPPTINSDRPTLFSEFVSIVSRHLSPAAAFGASHTVLRARRRAAAKSKQKPKS